MSFLSVLEVLPESHKHDNAVKMQIHDYLANEFGVDSTFELDDFGVGEYLIIGYQYWIDGKRVAHCVKLHWTKQEPLKDWFPKQEKDLPEKLSIPKPKKK